MVAAPPRQRVQRDTAHNGLSINYLRLRQAIGGIAAGFPIVLFAGGLIFGQWPQSISGYYFSSMRNVLVAALCAISVFLLAYNGYDDLDFGITFLAGIFTLGVAFFPTANARFHPHWASYIHHVCSSLMMVFLAIMALQFTRTDLGTPRGQRRHLWYICGALLGRVSPTAEDEGKARKKLANLEQKQEEPQDPMLASHVKEEVKKEEWELRKIIQKRQRNRIYIWCARLILVWIACAVAQNYVNAPDWHLFFFCELLALWTFAVSWFTKGQLLRKDPPEPRLTD